MPTDSQSRQCRPHGKEGRWASAGRKPVIQHLIGILGRDQPGLKNSCFQVQLENVNETYFFLKKNINLSTSTEAKTGFKSAKVKKLSSLTNHSVTKIHYIEIWTEEIFNSEFLFIRLRLVINWKFLQFKFYLSYQSNYLIDLTILLILSQGSQLLPGVSWQCTLAINV